MEWYDDGIVLTTRKHGESSAIITLLTREHGRHAGLVRGNTGRHKRGLFEPGNRVRANWRARLAEHLGSFNCEMTVAVSAPFLNDRLRLGALSSVCAVAETALPEREPFTRVFEGLGILLDALNEDIWPIIYVKWELGLLQELGFQLDLSRCAVSGQMGNLTHVSPRTGRAVSGQIAEPYKHILLRLPPFLTSEQEAVSWRDILDGLRLTGFFMERQVYLYARNNQAPPARERLIHLIQSEIKAQGTR